METRTATGFEWRPLFGITGLLLLITSVAYPLAVTGIAQVAFPRQANGSIVTIGGTEVGSALLGQAFAAEEYFHPRPSAAGEGYDAGASSGSNFGMTNQKLLDRLAEDGKGFRGANGLADGAMLPSDAITASGSGLDPHISPATARLQVARVAIARGAKATDIEALLNATIEGRDLLLVGEPRVNVLRLNMALDAQFPKKP